MEHSKPHVGFVYGLSSQIYVNLEKSLVHIHSRPNFRHNNSTLVQLYETTVCWHCDSTRLELDSL